MLSVIAPDNATWSNPVNQNIGTEADPGAWMGCDVQWVLQVKPLNVCFANERMREDPLGYDFTWPNNTPDQGVHPRRLQAR